MLKLKINQKTALIINQSKEGERIEDKVERIMTNNDPIEDGAPIIYTERKDGVRPEYDPRTDRFDLAVEAMDTASKSNYAKRMNGIAGREGKNWDPIKGFTEKPDQPN